MNLVILDGCVGDPTVSRHFCALAERLGAAVTHFPLAEQRLAPCLGDFECWIKTPGLCRTQDAAQEVAEAMQRADLVIFLSPVTFGGYSSALKKAVDRLIGLVQPFFHDRDGLTRHLPRYARYAPLFVVGITEGKDEEAVATFRELALGNAINLVAPACFTQVIALDSPGWAGELESGLLGALKSENPVRPCAVVAPDALEQACLGDQADAGPAAKIGSAVVLVGSARPKGTSTSEALARELIGHLQQSGVATSVVYASQFIKAGRAAEQALDAMLGAELLVISAPLYVDGLPYLVTSALEQLAARMGRQAPILCRLAGILNCGYPEAIHNRIAMRLLRHFAQQNRLVWAGGLALGGGEIIHGRSPAALRFVFPAPARALRSAALALSAGTSIPAEAIRLMAKPLVSARLFRWVARLRWVVQARANRVGIRNIVARPWSRSGSASTPVSANRGS